MENNAILLASSEPFTNKMLKIRKLYWICLASTLLGTVVQPLMGIGILGFIVVYIMHEIVLKFRTGELRDMRFRRGSITSDDLFAKLQTVLLAQYQGAIMMERNEKQQISFTFDGHIYDLILHDDNTFSLWWRMSAGKALLSMNDYKSYRKLLVGYGVLAYHIQQCSGCGESES